MFLKYFDGVNRRAMRDIAALPPEADGWKPAAGVGENSWSINQLVGHMAGSRLYFASAYLQKGWITPQPPDTSNRDNWMPALEDSAAEFRRQLEGTPDEWLERKVEMIDTPGGGLSGWRVLLMMVEHDIHHRSQIDTYAGLNGWGPPHIYGRAAEDIAALQDSERAKQTGKNDGRR
ncbi:MAG: DinB family protein [Dehalococcoidia bacterium]